MGVLGPSLGGTGGGPEPAETLLPFPFLDKIERLEKSGMEGRPMLEEDFPEKLESVGDEGLELAREESRLMGFDDRDDSVGSTVWEEGREGGGEMARFRSMGEVRVVGEVGRLPFRWSSSLGGGWLGRREEGESDGSGRKEGGDGSSLRGDGSGGVVDPRRWEDGSC